MRRKRVRWDLRVALESAESAVTFCAARFPGFWALFVGCAVYFFLRALRVRAACERLRGRGFAHRLPRICGRGQNLALWRTGAALRIPSVRAVAAPPEFWARARRSGALPHLARAEPRRSALRGPRSEVREDVFRKSWGAAGGARRSSRVSPLRLLI